MRTNNKMLRTWLEMKMHREQPVSKIEGRVLGDVSILAVDETKQGIADAAVTLVEVQPDESLETVSRRCVQTESDGHFILETDLDGVSGLIVIAQNEHSTWKARITETVHHGTTVHCPPITDETTLEVDTSFTLLSWER